MEEKRSTPPQEFLVVILATKSGLGRDTDIQILPSLIEIKGQPLLIHQIVNGVKSGFSDFIIVYEEGDEDVQKCVKVAQENAKEFFKLTKIRFSSVSHDVSQKSASMLQSIAPLLTTDFIVIEGNVAFNFPLFRLVDMHKARKAACTVVLKDRGEKGVSKDAIANLIGFCEDSSRLVVWLPESSQYSIPDEVLLEFPCIQLSTSLEAMMVFIMSTKIMPFIAAQTDMSFGSISFDIVPFLVSKQPLNLTFPADEESDEEQSGSSSSQIIIHSDLTESDKEKAPQPISTYGFFVQKDFCERITSQASLKLVKNVQEKSKEPLFTLLP
ncbi:Translation initiation factor eIF-2B subunit gamma [Monocercomonoides exilis]|uniref:Translation initiation factor eIF-2B subunit gamma n=1 Tax=Monocercomonoides exilis TaxID=2049356 RepID=UPI00355A9D11|nr:Translation initiation factor eIF-2B subunit gamma [Monocercomonoides exilis]|eukprot:MONOS_1562.1-p1 / transcript=MONOS_1562.1 / gene=MONOS_1562 / organism=Monocercomonoides_exilis_PA203 / gene_product=Translation initiation factor eIF-2B subunit gamma / transcript_product=Translation initiation factor eIF-2B subunit gamma / location=Mono_scaffold00028:40453-41865(-) / protein_length=326 / sequence_SO=supercontig / SO=protein_coding / is_pseudo=false